TRFTGDLGSYRVDYWRVALRVGAQRPVTGVGAGNFGAAYLARRHTPQAPLYAHSGWLESFATLGVPGLAAMLAFALAVALGAPTPAARCRGGSSRPAWSRGRPPRRSRRAPSSSSSGTRRRRAPPTPRPPAATARAGSPA